MSASNVWKKLKGPASSLSSRAPTRSQWNPRVEINHYLDTPFADTELDFADGNDVNLLLWWKNHQRIYLVLSHFARDVLVVPVSTVSSEATFSTVGRIIELRRSSLTPEMVEALTCLKDWESADERTKHQLEDPEITEAIADLENLDVN